jgi:glycosyltransferase involved in cell wall biosynthesis
MSTDQPLVSIVTPSFNQGRFIADAIESVLSQDYPRIEYSVVDGGSADGTLDILRQYEGRLRWISEPDRGQAEAINKGWRLARGDILAWLNSDDIYRPGAVRAAVEAFARYPQAGAVYGDCDYISADGQFLEGYETYEFDYDVFVKSSRSPIPQPSTFLRREVLDRAGYLDETLQSALDWEYWLRVGAHYPIVYVPQTLAGYRVHAASKSATQNLRCGVETVRVYRRMFSDPHLPLRLRRFEREGMNSVLLWAAQYAFMGAYLSEARRYLIQGWKYRPFHVRRFMPKILLVSLLGRRGWLAWMRFRRWRGARLGVFETSLAGARAA